MSDIVIASLIGIIPGLLTLAMVMHQGRQLKDVHTLVNSNMGIQLALNAANARWRADKENRPEDIEAAEKAEALLREHETKQAQVDART